MEILFYEKPQPIWYNDEPKLLQFHGPIDQTHLAQKFQKVQLNFPPPEKISLKILELQCEFKSELSEL